MPSSPRVICRAVRPLRRGVVVKMAPLSVSTDAGVPQRAKAAVKVSTTSGPVVISRAWLARAIREWSSSRLRISTSRPLARRQWVTSACHNWLEGRRRSVSSRIGVAGEHGWASVATEVMPDHVPLFVRVGPTDAPAAVVRAFKGRTARVLRQEFPHLRNHAKVLWSPSYFAASIGYVSESTVRRYIEHQWEAVWRRETVLRVPAAPDGASAHCAGGVCGSAS